MYTKKMLTNDDVYAKITDRIINMLEAGEIPWRKPWSNAGVLPMNLISKKQYRGGNCFLLAFSSYTSPFWATFNQIKKLGGYVKKDEKATCIVYGETFYKNKMTGKYLPKGKIPSLSEIGDYDEIPVLKMYSLFNLEQTEGIAADKIPKIDQPSFDPIDKAEQMLSNNSNIAPIQYSKIIDPSKGRIRAFYRPSEDFIQLPTRDLFDAPEEFYCTAFHEMVHSTGHPNRLNREMQGVFGDEEYGKEELIAEFGAAYLCALCGIEQPTLENSAAYIQNWLQALKNDKKLILQAGAKAQQAANYISTGIVCPELEAEAA